MKALPKVRLPWLLRLTSSQPFQKANAMARAAKTKSSDAISLLKSDHRKVEGLFERYEKSRSYARG